MKFSKRLFMVFTNKRSYGEIPPIHTNLALRNHASTNSSCQGTPYFLAFTAAFPTVLIWLKPMKRSVKLWQGLGYYSRASNLHKTQYVAWELAGVFQII
jgi:hypothetical protein